MFNVWVWDVPQTWDLSVYKADRFQIKSQEVAGTSLAVEFVIFNYQPPALPFSWSMKFAHPRRGLEPNTAEFFHHCWVWASCQCWGQSGIALPHLPHPPWTLHREVLRRPQQWHPLPALGKNWSSFWLWVGRRALLVDTKLIAIKPRLLLLLFNVQVIDFHWLFSSFSAWLINAHSNWHFQRICAAEGQGSSGLVFYSILSPETCCQNLSTAVIVFKGIWKHGSFMFPEPLFSFFFQSIHFQIFK